MTTLFSGALAQSTCVLTNGELIITATGDTYDILAIREGDAITVLPEICQGATVFNVDRIVVKDQTDHGGLSFHISLEGGPLAPGATTETTGESEIEIAFEYGTATDLPDLIVVAGSDSADSMALGTDGIALNADDDADVTLVGEPTTLRTSVLGFAGDDTISGQGGSGTGAPYSYSVKLHGGNGNDSISGGDAADRLEGANGNDVEQGGPGDDRFQQGVLGNGSDVIDGGEGYDFADYLHKGVPISISADDVANDGEPGENDNILAIEAFRSCDGSDVLTGSAGDDMILGKGGSDEMDGTAGADDLEGGAGPDFVLGGDGDDRLVGGPGKDRLNGGPWFDTCVVFKGDGDKRVSCEKVITKRHR